MWIALFAAALTACAALGLVALLMGAAAAGDHPDTG
jgi:hypothetical protein